MNYQIIILAAGKGTRMGHSELPKVLVPLANKPIIFHLLEEIKKLEENIKPIIVVGYKYQLVQSMLGPNYIYAFQEGQFGTAHAVSSAKKHINTENVLVLYGDMPFITAESLNSLFNQHKSTNSVLTIFTTDPKDFKGVNSGFNGFGRIIRDKNNQIAEIKEFVDASEDQRKQTEVNPGIYLINSDWLWQNIEKIPKNSHDEYYLTDIVAIAKKQDIQIESLQIDCKEVVGINTPDQLIDAEQLYYEKSRKK